MDWFRLHAKILNDPRVQTLDPFVFKLYINALCHACLLENDGQLGTLDDVSFAFRETKEAVSSAFHALIERGLVATVDETFHIPQWRKKQFKSDTSTERVKRFRKRCETVSETAPEQSRTDTDTEQKEEENIGAVAPEIVPRETPRQILETVLSREKADAVIKHRKALRKPLTDDAAKLLIKALAKCRDGPERGAEMMIERAWLTYKPEWDKDNENGADRQSREQGIEQAIAAGYVASRQLVSTGSG